MARQHVADPTVEFTVAHHGHSGYGRALKGAFPFFRAHSGGRYSSTSIMRLVAAMDRLDSGSTNGLPSLLVAATPYSYDEETECKKGGVVGMLVCWPQDEGRLMVAVHKARRRQKIGTALLRYYLAYESATAHAWVSNRNFAGQAFLLANELYPTGMNSSGAVRYATETQLTDEGDEGDQPSVADLAAYSAVHQLASYPTPWDQPLTVDGWHSNS